MIYRILSIDRNLQSLKCVDNRSQREKSKILDFRRFMHLNLIFTRFLQSHYINCTHKTLNYY